MTPDAGGILQLAWTQLWQVTLLIVTVAGSGKKKAAA